MFPSVVQAAANGLYDLYKPGSTCPDIAVIADTRRGDDAIITTRIRAFLESISKSGASEHMLNHRERWTHVSAING